MPASLAMKRRPNASVEYKFEQSFRVPAKFAYAWATNFTPRDWQIGKQPGARRITNVARNVVILHDTFPRAGGGHITKSKIVHLYPETLTWTNTHISGPRIRSQFHYVIEPRGPRNSILRFQGRELVWERVRGGKSSLERMRRNLEKEDHDFWGSLARAMEQDFAKGRR